jgi:hypothetical protein
MRGGGGGRDQVERLLNLTEAAALDLMPQKVLVPKSWRAGLNSNKPART